MASILNIRPVDETAFITLTSAGIKPPLARLFASRGVQSPQETDTSLKNLPHFSSLKNIAPTAARLVCAIQNGEKITVAADYDADGATACAVAVRGLSALGANIDFIVPNRFTQGYGLSPALLEEIIERHAPKVVLTVDNGIASVAAATMCRERGIDLVVTDHHLPGETLPDTPYLVNPNQPGDEFPTKNLAGVGVMFYVLSAVRAAMRGMDASRGAALNLATLLDFVALGTVADVVPLDSVNRILVSNGIARIKAGLAHEGIKALFEAAGRSAEHASSFDFGFALGPRLNAAGRMKDMTVGIQCLLNDDPFAARAWASQLDRLNRERRTVEADIQEEALADIDSEEFHLEDRFSLCVARPEWHTGVIGIVAGRLKEKYHRPAIVFGSVDEGDVNVGEHKLRGSGRSIPGFHLRDALDLVSREAPEVIQQFGGHAMAAGLTIAERDFGAFADVFERVAKSRLTPEMLNETVESDGDLAMDAMNLDFALELRDMIWGASFPPPLFDGVFDVLQQKILKEKHSRLTLAKDGKRFSAILFNDASALPPKIRAAYRLDVNEYLGLVTLQLMLEKWWEI